KTNLAAFYFCQKLPAPESQLGKSIRYSTSIYSLNRLYSDRFRGFPHPPFDRCSHFFYSLFSISLRRDLATKTHPCLNSQGRLLAFHEQQLIASYWQRFFWQLLQDVAQWHHHLADVNSKTRYQDRYSHRLFLPRARSRRAIADGQCRLNQHSRVQHH